MSIDQLMAAATVVLVAVAVYLLGYWHGNDVGRSEALYEEEYQRLKGDDDDE